MFLIVGTINDSNEKAVRKMFPGVWKEPAANLSLFDINALRNSLLDIMDTDIAIWTNHPELIGWLVANSELVAVDEGVLLKTELPSPQPGDDYVRGPDVVEHIARNWHIIENSDGSNTPYIRKDFA